MLFLPTLGKGTVGRWAGALNGRQRRAGKQCAEMGKKGAMTSALLTMCTDASLPLIVNLNLVCLTVDSCPIVLLTTLV
jgi:hypothetical protein